MLPLYEVSVNNIRVSLPVTGDLWSFHKVTNYFARRGIPCTATFLKNVESDYQPATCWLDLVWEICQEIQSKVPVFDPCAVRKLL